MQVHTRIIWCIQSIQTMRVIWVEYLAYVSNTSIRVESNPDPTHEASLSKYMWVFEYLKYFFDIRACLTIIDQQPML